MRFLALKSFRAAALAALLCGAAPWAVAQDTKIVRSPILTIDSDRLFNGSAFGLRVLADFEASGRALEAENRAIEADLQEEERLLTDQRPGMTPEAFRALADAFDTKVEQIRSEQNAKLRVLTQRRENARRVFFSTATPVLENVMASAGAAVIVESRSIFMSAGAIDVTQTVIDLLDQEIGDGLVPVTVAPSETGTSAGDRDP